MKKIIPSIFFAASASSSILLAENTKITSADSNSSLLHYSNINEYQPQLMMDPSTIEGGTQALGEALGLFGKEAVAADKAVVEGERAERSDIASAVSPSSSSNQVLRLRGGGPKKSQPTGGLKSTGDSSDEDDNVSDADSSASEDIQDMLNAQIDGSIETTRRAHVANNLLEKKQQAKKEFKKQQALASGHSDDDTRSVGTVDSTVLRDMIYKTTLYEKATLQKEQGNLQSSHSPSSKDQELAAKKKMTFLFHENSKLAVDKAQRAEEVAKSYLKEEEEKYKEVLANQHATSLEQENSSLNIIYQRALAIQATSDHELRKAQRELAEAKLATVNAELALQEAQHIQTDLSSLNEAQTAFELAREEEEKMEQKTDPIANEAATRNSWCEALKKAFEATVITNDLREAIPLLPSSALRAPNWNDILQEAQYTEHAWNEVIDTCNGALNNKPALALKKAWEKDLEEAVNQHVLWQVRVLWWKTMKTAESAKISNISQDLVLQQAKEIDSVYDEMVAMGRKKQDTVPERLKFWWSHDLQQIEAQRIAHKKELTRLQEAETRRKAKAETERIAAEEALEQEEQERAAKKEADRIAQENAEAKKRAEARASQEFKADIERAREAERAEWTWNGWALAEVDRIAEDINTSWIDWEPTRAAAAQRSYRLIHGVGTQTATFVQRTFPVVTNAAITSVSNLITWASQVVRRVWGEGVERQVIVKEVEAANPQVQRINEARAKAAKATESAQECQEKGKTAREASKGWVIYLFNPSNIEVKEKEAKYWEEAAACLRDASRSWSEVEKELTQGNQRRAASWSDAGTQYEKAAKLYYSAANNPAANLQGNIKISGEALRTNAEEYERKARNL